MKPFRPLNKLMRQNLTDKKRVFRVSASELFWREALTQPLQSGGDFRQRLKSYVGRRLWRRRPACRTDPPSPPPAPAFSALSSMAAAAETSGKRRKKKRNSVWKYMRRMLRLGINSVKISSGREKRSRARLVGKWRRRRIFLLTLGKVLLSFPFDRGAEHFRRKSAVMLPSFAPNRAPYRGRCSIAVTLH